MQTPIIEELAKKMTDAVDIRKVDVDQNMDLAEKYGIRVVPTLIIEKDGRVVHSLEGVTDATTLEKLLRPLVG
jgi:thioredoxin 1